MIDFTHYRAKYLRQPAEVSIETFALCNAACTFCPYPTLTRQGAKMDEPTLRDLIRQMRGWSEPFFISPFKVNEPLLDDRLPDLCGEIVESIPRATLRLFTNGSPLTPDQIEWIAQLPRGRVAHLWISLNSMDKQEYGQLMKLSLAITVKRLDALHNRVLAGDFPHPVVVSRVMQDSTLGAPGRLTHYGPRDSAFLVDCHENFPRFTVQLIKKDAWIDFTAPSDGSRVPSLPCARWFELNICADGEVALCCMTPDSKYGLGNIHQSTLLEVYNQPELLQRREFAIHREGITPCSGCTY